ncbi:MAG: PAS domain S-box protein [Pirellulales bacterium]|nr:PAS domain S-box protein [Pirellulales bacterium]
MSDHNKTKQQLVEELTALRQQVADQRRITDNLPVLVATAGFDGYYKEVNAAFTTILGWSEQELLSRPVFEFVHLSDRVKATAHLEKLKRGETLTNYLDRKVCKDGSCRWIDWVVIPVPDREIVFGIGRDITDERWAKEALEKAHDELEERVAERTSELRAVNKALQESEANFRTLVDMSPDAVFTGDLTGRVTFASRQALQMYGAESVEEMRARNPLDFFDPKDRPRFLANLQKTLEEGMTRDIEYELVRKDGTHFIGELSAATIHDTTGKPECFVAVLRDITERKQTQDALERERQSLWKMLQASDHERQIIAYDIHDGLAQYLAAAGMEFQAFNAMKQNAPQDAEKSYQTAVELIRRAHAEARRLISEVRHPVIDERGLATAIVSMACEQQKCGGPKIECHTSVRFDRLPPILENALYRMVQEALTNACKHSKSEKVTVTMVQEGQDVRLEVQDWGIGFNTEAIDKGHFGLESIRQRARLLGGRLTIQSTPGAGALVRVVVPILENHTED